MNRLLRSLLSAIAFVAVSPAMADEGALPTPPPEPLIKKAPTYSSWTILYTPKQAPASPGPTGKPLIRSIKQVVVVKAGGTLHEVKTWSDGLTSEKWLISGYMLMNQPGARDIYILRTGLVESATPSADNADAEFPELDWISSANFKETTSYQGHPCYHFQAARNLPSAPVVQAWIDGETGLPLAMDDSQATQKYTFEDSSAKQLVLPDSFAQALAKYRKIVADAGGHP